jgi:hypothetical protein
MPDRNDLKRKDLFLFMVSEVSEHGSLAPCSWAEHHGSQKSRGRGRWKERETASESVKLTTKISHHNNYALKL